MTTPNLAPKLRVTETLSPLSQTSLQGAPENIITLALDVQCRILNWGSACLLISSQWLICEHTVITSFSVNITLHISSGFTYEEKTRG